LEAFLKDKNINSIIFMGINFPNCPRASIYQASERDFKICVVKDGMSRLYSQGIDELKNIGVHILSKNEVIRQINNKKYA
jgi:nicotinamidase-related amidase